MIHVVRKHNVMYLHLYKKSDYCFRVIDSTIPLFQKSIRNIEHHDFNSIQMHSNFKYILF